MDNEFFRPYAGELYNKTNERRFYVYDRDELRNFPIFPYLVLDGGAFFFTNEHYGSADSETLLKKTVSGEVFDIFRDETGNIDWARSHHFCDSNVFHKMFEWESWPQRLYMLLPLAQEYMKTGDRFYSDKWFRIFSKWVKDSPYEPV